MSITYCHNCNKYVDLDFDAGHIEDCVATDPLEHIVDANKKIKEMFEYKFVAGGDWAYYKYFTHPKTYPEAHTELQFSPRDVWEFIEKEIQEAYKKGYIDGGLNK